MNKATTIIVDAEQLHSALRAALAIAPRKDQYAVIGVRLSMEAAEPPVVVCAYNPSDGVKATITVEADSVEIVNERDRFVEITLPVVRELLAMRIHTPREDEPLPLLSWQITEKSIVQADAGVLFGRSFRVWREDPDYPTLDAVPDAVRVALDSVPSVDGVVTLTPRHAAIMKQVLGHLGQSAWLQGVDAEEPAESALIVGSSRLAAHLTVAPSPPAAVEMPQPPQQERPAPVASVVRAAPPGGVA